MAKAAIVIGVDKTGELQKLEGAAASATEVASWLKGEGYVVSLFTDENESVHAADVRQALEDIVTEPARYDLLVIYFSGHGYWHARSDLWLFSDAPDNSADAINLGSAVDVAKTCGIETVVFISDACRNIPGRKGQRVNGIDALPNIVFNSNSKVDTFKATSEAQSAYEAVIPEHLGGSGKRESVMTKALRRAFQEPTEDMVAETEEDGVSVKVVPNRKLEGYLQDKVDEFLAAVDPNVQQTLEINVPSHDKVYLAKVTGAATSAPSPPLRSLDPGRQAASAAFDNFTAAESEFEVDQATESQLNRLLPRHDVVTSFETECGFVVSDVVVEDATATHEATVQILDSGKDSGAAVLRIDMGDPAASLVVQLTDGRSFVLPALHGYIGHVALDDKGVSNVAFVPSQSNYRYGDGYGQRKEKLDRLRALVALSIDQGSFKVSEEEAPELADAIRVEKALDPSLGLYAAHAYSAAGLDHQVVDVLRYMWDDLNTSLYDVVLLASRQIDPDNWSTVPFSPILTQSWNLLRPRSFKVHPILARLRPVLRDSLWTTFGPEAEGTLLDAVNEGKLL